MRSRPRRVRHMAAFVFGLAAALIVGPQAPAPRAQGLGFTNKSDEPVVIEAEKSVEWHKQKQVYLARGNARAKRGGTTVRADVLTAHYRKGKKSDTRIWKVTAVGNVRIVTAKETITGQKGVYLVEKGVFILTGNNLKLATAEQTVTARDRLEYRLHQKIAIVAGNATVTEGKKKVRADRFVAYLKEVNGKTKLRKVNAVGRVRVTTATEIATGNKGVYNGETEIATLTGNVKLTKGGSQLNGHRAEVNLKTGVSKLLAGTDGAGPKRVQGVFVPRDDDKKSKIGTPGLILKRRDRKK